MLVALRDAPGGMNRTQISKLFAGHQNAEQIIRALAVLQSKGFVTTERVSTGGRPTEMFRLA
jgi:predicted ArsR family transcriptional regulator